jgi:hypothetical protein
LGSITGLQVTPRGQQLPYNFETNPTLTCHHKCCSSVCCDCMDVSATLQQKADYIHTSGMAGENQRRPPRLKLRP